MQKTLNFGLGFAGPVCRCCRLRRQAPCLPGNGSRW